jgi:hypothetical protein
MTIDRRAFVLGGAALAAACTGYPSESRRARAVAAAFV